MSGVGAYVSGVAILHGRFYLIPADRSGIKTTYYMISSIAPGLILTVRSILTCMLMYLTKLDVCICYTGLKWQREDFTIFVP